MKFHEKSAYTTVRFVSFSTCLIFLSLNVFTTVREYFSYETIECMTEKQPPSGKGGVYLPDIVVCPQKHFVDPRRHMLTLEDFMNNTHDPGPVGIELFGPWQNEFNWTKEHIYTYSYGRCILVRFPIPVSNPLLTILKSFDIFTLRIVAG